MQIKFWNFGSRLFLCFDCNREGENFGNSDLGFWWEPNWACKVSLKVASLQGLVWEYVLRVVSWITLPNHIYFRSALKRSDINRNNNIASYNSKEEDWMFLQLLTPFSLEYSQKMETSVSFGTLILSYQTARRHIPYNTYIEAVWKHKTQLYRFIRTSQETHYVSATSPTG
jgi:hypothetical protein